MFNENTRVKIPALIHFTRLGYKYISLKDKSYKFDPNTNIITNIFLDKLKSLNHDLDEDRIIKEFINIKEELDFDDLGRSFYNRLLGQGSSDIRLIDWENFNNNSFHVTTELSNKNGEDEFIPDITVFINGMPLSFLEVKIPNNNEGIKAEYDRINMRFKNEKFRKFVNITQILVFSNNMEYDDADLNKLQGAFYATTAKNSEVKFNNFREQLKSEIVDEITEIKEEIEDSILADNKCTVIKHSPEFATNKEVNSPTNRIISSLFSKKRLKEWLKYAICYVDQVEETTGLVVIQKHIMRYPQFFATKAIKNKLNSGVKRGVIWHTQGSGKTALAFYNIRSLKDYFAKKGIIPKFYFIVDRLDLANQSRDEFSKRALKVNYIKSKEELQSDFSSNTTSEGITVVNIQKFREDTTTLRDSGYNINVQKVFFIDEAHRSYDPKGSFLANLYSSDQNSIKIALTGTPLIIYKDHEKDGDIKDASKKEESKTTRNIFGDYIHKYYYNDSIRDGYTLKLLREEIETNYKERLNNVIHDIKVHQGSIDKRDLYSHEKFVEPMLNYILKDFINSRIRFGDKTIGGMVVCDSSEQARVMFNTFEKLKEKHRLSSALILHDEDNMDVRKSKTKDFKDGKIDLLFVYSMLLTGFDAPRLKKLYLGRKIRAHSLLQTLTRVNRPYKNFKIGYVVDFADISSEFEITNQAYFKELKEEYKENLDSEDPDNIFGSLFMSQKEIEQKINEINISIIEFNTENLEKFNSQITEIENKEKIINLKNALESARDIYNVARLLGYTEILEKLDFKLLSKLLIIVSNRLKLLNLKDSLNDINSKELLNTAIENVVFNFTKVGEQELKIISEEMHNIASKVRTELVLNINKKDQEWTDLYQAFVKLLSNHNINSESINTKDMTTLSKGLKDIFDRIKELNRKNSLLVDKFKGDRKYAIIFKNTQSSSKISDNMELYNLMIDTKNKVDTRIQNSKALLNNNGFFRRAVGEDVLESFKAGNYKIDSRTVTKLVNNIVDEYFEEYKGV